MLALFAQADQPKIEVTEKTEKQLQAAEAWTRALEDFSKELSGDWILASSGIVGAVLTFVALICFLWVIVAMFKNDAKGMGIITILTFLFCGGIGVLLAFFMGWAKSGAWKIRGVMTIWTLSFLGFLAIYAYFGFLLWGFYQRAMPKT